MSVLTVTNATLTTSPANSVQIDNNFAAVVAWAAGNIGADNITAGAITQTELAAAGFNGTIAANVADQQVLGGLPVVFRITVPNTGTTTTTVANTNKIRVLDCWVVKTGGAADGTNDQVTLKTGGTAITDAMILSSSDKGITRATTIDDAQHEFTSSLQAVTSAITTHVGCELYVLAIRVA